MHRQVMPLACDLVVMKDFTVVDLNQCWEQVRMDIVPCMTSFPACSSPNLFSQNACPMLYWLITKFAVVASFLP